MHKYGPLELHPEDQVVPVLYPHPFVDVLDRMGAPAIFGDPDRTLSWIQGTSYEEFKKYLSWMNGIVRSAPDSERGLNDIDRIQFLTPSSDTEGAIERVYYNAPTQGTRNALLAETHRAIKRMRNLDSISKMLTVVMHELHGFSDGHKRSSRNIYGLGTNGYHGLPQERWDYSMAVYNMCPDMDVDFFGLHTELAERFTDTRVLELVGDSAIAERLTVEPVQPGAEAIGLSALMAEECFDYLSEEHFTLPLILSWVGLYGEYARKYISPDGKVSATAVFEDLTVRKAYRLWECNSALKVDYIRAIINSFKNDDASVFTDPIQEVIEPYFPSPRAARRRAVPVPTAALLPVFSGQPQDPWRI